AIMGRHIREHGEAWEVLLASPAERVRRTVEAAGLPMPVRWDERIYLADSEALLEVIRGVEGEPGALLIAGHNPGLQQLIFELVAPSRENALFAQAAQKYPTATFAVLELDIDRWGDCASGCGTLVHLARPRDLDPMLGPDEVG